MEVFINNKIKKDHEKVQKTVRYYFDSVLKKFQSLNYKIEVGIKNKKSSKSDPIYSCGVTVKRPGRKPIHVEKTSRRFGSAIKSSTLVVSRIIGGS